MTKEPLWVPCTTPVAGDIIRWEEPLWAKPNKPRGKPQKVGEQRVTGKVVENDELVIIEVMDVEKLTRRPAPLNVKADDIIRRKMTSIAMGDCVKQTT